MGRADARRLRLSANGQQVRALLRPKYVARLGFVTRYDWMMTANFCRSMQPMVVLLRYMRISTGGGQRSRGEMRSKLDPQGPMLKSGSVMGPVNQAVNEMT